METTPQAVESSPCGHKEEKPHQKLSSSLKERLKRSRRSFTSPLSVARRLCVDNVEEGGRRGSADSHKAPDDPLPVVRIVDLNKNDMKSAHVPPKYLTQQQDHLRREVKDKTETLRRLRMVKMYRSKNDLTQLQALIDKWRSCAQAALCELQSDVPVDGRKASLSELIDLFGLDDRLLHFDRAEEDFTS